MTDSEAVHLVFQDKLPDFVTFSNIPAVYDVLAAWISKCAAFAGRTKCGGCFAWE
jgi:hypothetical protein